MAKIHSHYDNLKVARQAPQEVIRAAYKALSQKYHPDKNPGDEKAARIMAIINTAYTTLSDPQRRREHDEWIAAEEWEIEWLESTRHEDGRDKHHGDKAHADSHWKPENVANGWRLRWRRNPTLWVALAGCFVLGAVAGGLASNPPRLVSGAMSAALGGRADAKLDLKAEAKPDFKTELKAEPRVRLAARTEAADGLASPMKALAVAQVLIPLKAPDCESDLHSLAAPNGEPWPQRSGYVDGYPLGNPGEQFQLMVDNSANALPVFVKVIDLEQRSAVRHLFVLAHDRLVVDQLSAARYELRYQNVELGADAASCGRKPAPIKQAAIEAG